MRTSNKILIGMLLSTILVFTSLFSAVRIKYERGDIVARDKKVNEWSNGHAINEKVRRVVINGIDNIDIVPSDSARLELSKSIGRELKWKMENGVLMIESDSATVQGDQRYPHRVMGYIRLLLPRVDSIRAYNSTLDIKPEAGKTPAAYSFNLDLHAAQLKVVGSEAASQAIQYDSIAIRGYESKIEFQYFVHVKKADVQLLRSSVDEWMTDFDNLHIATDSTSQFHVRGRNLIKAKVTSKE